MNRVPRERVEELLADATTEYNSARTGNDDEAARFWGPMKSALTRLLALEDALKEAQIALFHGAAYIEAECARNIGDSRRTTLLESVFQLKALAALGGDK